MKKETRKGQKRDKTRKRTNRRKKKGRKEKEKIKLAMRSTFASRVRIVYESKSVRISLQKHNKMTKRILSWIPIAIKSSAIMENMSS